MTDFLRISDAEKVQKKCRKSAETRVENEQRRPRSQISDLGRGTHTAARGARATTCAVHAASAMMVAEATRGVETRARKRKRDLAAQAGVAFPGLPFDVAVSLVAKHLPDPADLARV